MRSAASAAGMLVALALGGCAVGPDFTPPPAPRAAAFTANRAEAAPMAAGPGETVQRGLRDATLRADWWTLFHSPALSTLADRALAANPDIEAAKAALRQAREVRLAEGASFFPQLQGLASVTRYKTATSSTASPATLNQGGLPPALFDFYTTELDLNYTPDVFGANRRAYEMTKAAEETAKFQLIAADLTITGNVVALAVGEAALRAQITATERLVAIEKDLTRLAQRQRDIGANAGLDVLAQQTAEASAEAGLVPLQKALAQGRDALAALVGALPAEAPSADFALTSFDLPADLPLGVPSSLVAQRPDVRAALANLHEATAVVGVAVADMLPQFTLTATLGSTGFQPGNLFGPGYGFWTLGTSLAQTLFDAGALLHKKRAAVAAMDQAAAQYRATVLAAFQNVADTLQALSADGATLAADARARTAAESAFAIAARQYRLGTISSVVLLTAEQSYLQAELAFIGAKAARLMDTAALFQALGGGWWNAKGARG